MLDHHRGFQVFFAVCLSLFLFTHLSDYTPFNKARHVARFLGTAGDFRAYYHAAVDLRAGKSGYARPIHPVTPPFLTALLVPFTFFSENAACKIFQWLILLVALALATLFGFAQKQSWWGIFLLAVLWVTSQPFHFAFERANPEVLSLALLAVAFFLREKGSPWIAGSLLGIAMGLKTNTAVALPIFLITGESRRSRQLLIVAVVVVAATCLLTYAQLPAWGEELAKRVNYPIDRHENASIARLFAGWPAARWLAMTTVFALYGVVAVGLWRSRRETRTPFLAFFCVLPFTATFIPQTYPYSLFLFPLLIPFYLGVTPDGPRSPWVGRLGTAGVFLGYFPAIYFDFQYEATLGQFTLHAVMALATLCLCLASAVRMWPAATRKNHFFTPVMAAPSAMLSLLLSFVLIPLSGLAESAPKPVRAVSCRPRSAVARNVAARAPVSVETLSFKLEQPAYYLKDVLTLLQLTESGKDAATEFRRKYEAGTIKVEPISNEGEKRCPRIAQACYEPAKKTMFVDKGAELGSLAPTLYHEILHALDGEIEALMALIARPHPAHLKTALLEAITIGQFRAERWAYDGSYPVQKELLEMFPAYYRAKRDNAAAVNVQAVTDDEIVSAYSFPREVVERFLKGHCEPLPAGT